MKRGERWEKWCSKLKIGSTITTMIYSDNTFLHPLPYCRTMKPAFAVANFSSHTSARLNP